MMLTLLCVLQLAKARSSSKTKEVSKIIESSSPGPFRPPPLPAGASRAIPVQPFKIETSKKRQRPPMQGASEPGFDEDELDFDDAVDGRGETPSPEQPKKKAAAAAQKKAKSTLANSTVIRAASSSTTAKRAEGKLQYREDDGEETPEEDESEDEDYDGPKPTRGKAPVASSTAGKKVSVLSRAKASKAAADALTDVTKTPLLTKKTLKPRMADTNAVKALDDGEPAVKKGKAMQVADIRAEKENSNDKAEGGAKKKRKLLGNKAALGSLTLAGGEVSMAFTPCSNSVAHVFALQGTSSLNPNFALPLELSPVKQVGGLAKPGIGRFGGR